MKSFDAQYIELLNDILQNGELCFTRELEHRRLFGTNTKVDLREGLPATTLRKLPIEKVLDEAIADLQGQYTREGFRSASIFWEGLYNSNGDLPHSYGQSYRNWAPPVTDGMTFVDYDHANIYVVDQLRNIIETLQTDKFSRRLVMQTYNPSLAGVPVPPCHTGFILNTSGDGEYLDMLVTHRSWDAVIGKVLDTLRHAMQLQIIAEMVGMKPRFLQITSTNTHIYTDNLGDVEKLLKRSPKEDSCLRMTCLKPELLSIYGLEDLRPEHFELTGYVSHPVMKVTYVR